MKLIVTNGNSAFNGDMLSLIYELKENASFVELWERAEETFDDPTLDLESICILECLNFRLACKILTKQEIVNWLIGFLG